jgi:hemerythrin
MEAKRLELMAGGADVQVRTIVELTTAIEACVAAGDSDAALHGLARLREALRGRFSREERHMEGVAGHDLLRHRREHQALLSGLGAIHCAIVAENIERLSGQVSAYVNRVARHVIEQDVPFSESLAAA